MPPCSAARPNSCLFSPPSDRRSVHWDPSNPWIPHEWRHPASPGDGSFSLTKLVVEDMLCTVYQPGGFRPFNISVFKAELGKFRKKWAFYDFLVSLLSFLCDRHPLTSSTAAQNAEGVTGQYDGCLVSLHKPQRIGKTVGEDLKDGSCERMVRLSLPIARCCVEQRLTRTLFAFRPACESMASRSITCRAQPRPGRSPGSPPASSTASSTSPSRATRTTTRLTSSRSSPRSLTTSRRSTRPVGARRHARASTLANGRSPRLR